MSEELFDLIFRGELVKNIEASQARQNVQQLFKIPVTKVDALFSGKPVVLKRGLNMDAANKYRVAIKKAGALVDVIAQTPSAHHNDLVESSRSNSSSLAHEASKVKSTVSDSSVAISEFSVAPVGADVLNPDERKVEKQVEFDLSAYTVRSADGLLLDVDEIVNEAPVDIAVDWSIAEAGSDILTESQRLQEKTLELDLSALSLAEVGVVLVESEVETAVAPDVSHLSLKL